MQITEDDWIRYKDKMAALSDRAAENLEMWLQVKGGYQNVSREQLTQYMYGLATYYGEATASLAAEMYDEVAALSGVAVPSAEVAETASYGEIAKAVNAVTRNITTNSNLGNVVVRYVKRAAEDTTLKNVQRDQKKGAQFAWVPAGDTCAFCMMLASNGWQNQSKNAMKNGHASHIHPNCDCTYAVRFDGKSNVKGYNPDKYKAMYQNAEGRTWNDKLNSMRRIQYQKNKYVINAQKRANYAEKTKYKNKEKYGKIIIDGEEFVPCLRDVATGNIVNTVVEEVLDRQTLKGYNKNTGWYIDWSKIPKEARIYKLMVQDSDVIQGLVATTPVASHDAMYINWAVTAPHNNPLMLNGKSKQYEGVGGHLMAIVAEKSREAGFGGAAYGFAANAELMNYYIEKFGAVSLPVEHPYEIFYDEEAMDKLLRIYNYEWKE